jgi:hypothetical protein
MSRQFTRCIAKWERNLEIARQKSADRAARPPS